MTRIIHNIHLSLMFYVKSVHINNVHRPMGHINLLSLWGLLMEIKGFSGKTILMYPPPATPADIKCLSY